MRKNNIIYCGAAYAASQLHGTSIMKRIFIFLFLACICRGAEEINNELRFKYFSNSCVDIPPDKYIKIDYDNSMKKQALLSMLQLATIGLISHEEFILFTRGIMIRLPIFDEKSSILENDYYIKSRHMILRVTCFPQKECSGMCLLDYSDTKKMKSLYNPVEISKLNYHKKLAREIVEGELDLKLVDANESLYDEALEYALLRIKEYIINKRKQNLSLDEQEGVSTLHQMVQILVTRMYVRQLFDPFLTMNEKAAAWYLVKDCSVNGLKKLIYKSALIKRNNGVCIYSCPEKWKQQAEEWNAQSMAENWYREIRRLYPSNTEE